jgi:hypothetical protein
MTTFVDDTEHWFGSFRAVKCIAPPNRDCQAERHSGLVEASWYCLILHEELDEYHSWYACNDCVDIMETDEFSFYTRDYVFKEDDTVKLRFAEWLAEKIQYST